MKFIPYQGQALSNSALASVLRELLGQPDFFGDEKYLLQGNQLHQRLFEPRKKSISLDQDSQFLVDILYERLKDHPYCINKKGDQNEVEVFGKIYYLPFHGFVDKMRPMERLGVDLKTSAVRTEKAFITAAGRYGYWRQGFIYKKLTGVKHFIFLVISKTPPYRIFEINTDDYPREMYKAQMEIKFLTKIIKKYGIPERYINR